jgi:hypothetical protein
MLVSGPIYYRKLNFTHKEERRSLHLFGDEHGFRTECKEESIILPEFIEHTMREHPELEICVMIESSHAHNMSSLSKDIIGYTEDHFNQYGCFMNPKHERCSRTFPNKNFHPVNIRGDLLNDYIHVVNYLNKLFNFNGTQDSWNKNIVNCIEHIRTQTDIIFQYMIENGITTTREKLLWISDILESRFIRINQNHFVIPGYYESLALFKSVQLNRILSLTMNHDFCIDLYYYCIFHPRAPIYMINVLGIDLCDRDVRRYLINTIQHWPKAVSADLEDMFRYSNDYCSMLMDIRIIALLCSSCKNAIIVAGIAHCRRMIDLISSKPLLFSNVISSDELMNQERGQCIRIPRITFDDTIPDIPKEFPAIKPTQPPAYRLIRREQLGKKSRCKKCRSRSKSRRYKK